MGLSRNGPEINVTPLIDVLLVLLVIFLVVLPAMLKMEQVEVPREADPSTEPLRVPDLKVHADLGVTLVDEDTEIQVSGTDLPASLRAHLRSHRPHRVRRVRGRRTVARRRRYDRHGRTAWRATRMSR